MSAIVLARFSGSSISGGFGRPCATSQKLQRLVHTSPKIINVAVPWLKHSWIFGHEASSQTVTKRFSRSCAFSFATALPAGIRTRIQLGLRSSGASAKVTGLRAILLSPICLTPVSRLLMVCAAMILLFDIKHSPNLYGTVKQKAILPAIRAVHVIA